jgi:hypothetical protein
MPELRLVPARAALGRVLAVRSRAVSRYVHVALGAVSLDEVAAALSALEIPHAVGETMLQGSLECTGEPVALRVEPGPVGAVEDLGFALEAGTLRLVCGELDRARMDTQLLPRLQAEIARARVRVAGHDAGLVVEDTAGVITVRRR